MTALSVLNTPQKSLQTEEKTGLVLVNLGTPEKTDIKSVRRYLKEFLSDCRVIDANPFLWKLILNFIILPFRPHKTAKAYKAIWRQETNESPLRYYTRQQAKKLSRHFTKHTNLEVTWAMRYGNPSLKDVLNDLEQKGCKRLVILSLYPHIQPPQPLL